ncbi:MAG: RloB family protein [Prolixibacteraceae bacterium]|nr:RloB family protein [Prolixibacteraceae bacterium]
MGRRISKIKKFTSYAVLGDGQTEQYYLEHLKKIKGFKYIVRPRLFKSITIELADELIQEMLDEGYDMVVYFTDYDTIVKQGKIAKYNKILAKYRKRTDVVICESMPSIEFWFLLHYIKTTRNFQNAGEVLKELKKYIPAFSKESSFLEKQKWVEELCGDGKLTTAMTTSSEILAEKEQGNVGDYFPYTKVGVGIEWFEKNRN